jgi:hypothetical protein
MMRQLGIISILVLFLYATESFSQVYISEFSPSNQSIIKDDFGEYDDWIEIYNDSDFPVDVGGMYITDRLTRQTKFRIPSDYPDSTTIPPKGYLLFWADNQPEQGIFHLGFSLRRGGEQIGIVQSNGIDFIDSLTYGPSYTQRWSYSASVLNSVKVRVIFSALSGWISFVQFASFS